MWKDLKDMSDTIQGPWGVIGDFNESWEEEVFGNPLYIFHQKLKGVTKTLSQWSRQTYEDIYEVPKILEAEMRTLGDLCDKILRQKARAKLFEEGDDNTAYFHYIIKDRRKRPTICRIMDDQDQWVEGNDAITEATVRHFRHMFSQGTQVTNFDALNCIERIIEEEDNNNMLNAIPILQETKDSVFSIDSESAPGPDGLNGYFYQSIWDIISLTFIELLKLSLTLGFIKGRSITENIMLAQEIINDIRKPFRGGNVAIKLDMAKAYDGVNWKYLGMTLKKLGFSDWWIHLIQNFISSNWYSIIVNGGRYGLFKSERVLRQGDPISPFLFVINAELLFKMLNDLHDKTAYKGFYMNPNGPKIKHLAFVDDTSF
ncbi:uncharacterized protein LOC132628292 [Lycium barbarum]|uniref:uncharacterized protein LOC132628292 n=1 Tax=Lycium barbarum TaxID=112863 RepID=UPI00293E5CCA|nr:uncharacterized protein LOC132628292 [Lycium barbarum]